MVGPALAARPSPAGPREQSCNRSAMSVCESPVKSAASDLYSARESPSVPPIASPRRLPLRNPTLLRLTVLASGTSGVDRRMTTDVEGTTSLAALCVQAHPALVMAGKPVSFMVTAGSRFPVWTSSADGNKSLAELGLQDAASVVIRADVSDTPTKPTPPAAAPQPPAAAPQPQLPLPPPPPPPSPSQQSLKHDPTQSPFPIPEPSPAGLPPESRPPSEAGVAAAPTTPRSSSRQKRPNAISVTVKSREKTGIVKTQQWSVPAGEKLGTLCKRCNLTESQVSARNRAFKGFLVSRPSTGEAWNTKAHGRLSVREIQLTHGDELFVELDWENVAGSIAAKQGQAPSKHEPSPLTAAPQPERKPRVPLSQGTQAEAHRRKREEVNRRAHALLLAESTRGAAAAAEPAPGGLPAAAAAATSLSPIRPGSPGANTTLDSTIEAPILSPARNRAAASVPAVASPRGGAGVTEKVAWASFVEALSAVLHEQDLLLVSAETIRDLMRHYGFDRDPVTSAKIELQWKRLSGRAPPERAHRTTSAGRQARKADARLSGGATQKEPRSQTTAAASEEVMRRIERGQAGRRQVAPEESLFHARPAPGLPLCSPATDHPAADSSAAGSSRRLTQDPSIGRRRALSPTVTHKQTVVSKAHVSQQQPQQQQQQQHAPDLADATRPQESTCEPLTVYANETRPESSGNVGRQCLLSAGRRQLIRTKNDEQGTSPEYQLIGSNGSAHAGCRGKAPRVRDELQGGCDPNPVGADGGGRRGRAAGVFDAAPAGADPNAVNGPAAPPAPPQQRRLSKSAAAGPAAADPNALIAQQAPGAEPEARCGKKGTPAEYHADPAAGSDPNRLVGLGARRHEEAERLARAESELFFGARMQAHRPVEPPVKSDPNAVGAAGPLPKASRKAAEAAGGAQVPATADLCTLTQSPLLTLLHGPAGAAGPFSPGLAAPASRARGPAAAAASSNPNQTLAASTDNVVSHSALATAAVVGLPPATRRQAFDPIHPQSPRSLGKRRVAHEKNRTRAVIQ